MNLKVISPEAVPRALELVERYRLLNEAEQAESICRDILAIDPNNQSASRMLLLSICDQFDERRDLVVQDAQSVAANLADDYERHYFTGIIYERYGRAKMLEKQPYTVVSDRVSRAMEEFEKAEALRPAHDDAAILRWNTCVRMLERLPVTDRVAPEAEAFDYA